MTSATYIGNSEGDPQYARWYIGNSSGAVQAVISGYIGNAEGVVQQFYASLSATASPPSLISSSSSPGVQTTGDATVTPFGGIGPYTYSWSYVDGDTGITILSPSSATTAFRSTVNTVTTFRSADFDCLVIDTATGATTHIAPENVQIIYTGP
jgi:hypothetical protein